MPEEKDNSEKKDMKLVKRPPAVKKTAAKKTKAKSKDTNKKESTTKKTRKKEATVALTTKRALPSSELVMSKIREKLGPGSIMLAAESNLESIARLPTGIAVLDTALGGGIPRGRFTVFWGAQSSGKSSTAIRVASYAQRQCRNCNSPIIKDDSGNSTCGCKNTEKLKVLIVDVEKSFNADWAKKIGLDLNSCWINQAHTGEQYVDVIDAVLQARTYDLVIVDSVAMMTPMTEIDNSAEKASVALQARMITSALRKWNASLTALGVDEDKAPTVLLINQFRMDITMFGAREKKPGGVALDFVSAAEVYFRRRKQEKTSSYYDFDANQKTVNTQIAFRVEKNKWGPAGSEGVYLLWVRDHAGRKAGEVDDELSVIYHAEKMGLLQKKSSGFECQGEVFQSRVALWDRLRTDWSFYAPLRAKVIQDLIDAPTVASKATAAAIKKEAKKTDEKFVVQISKAVEKELNDE